MTPGIPWNIKKNISLQPGEPSIRKGTTKKAKKFNISVFVIAHVKKNIPRMNAKKDLSGIGMMCYPSPLLRSLSLK
jgi:hypothetical protein